MLLPLMKVLGSQYIIMANIETSIKENPPHGGIIEYRKKQKFLYDLRQKYCNKLEFNKKKLPVARIVSFVKKHLLFDPCNISDEDIQLIPGIYRFRCYVSDCTDSICLLNVLFDEQYSAIKDEPDKNTRDTLMLSMKNEFKAQRQSIIDSTTNVPKYPVLIDLRNVVDIIDFYINMNGSDFYLDTKTLRRLEKQHSKINPSSLNGEKFCQFIDFTKEIVKTYVADTKNE